MVEILIIDDMPVEEKAFYQDTLLQKNYNKQQNNNTGAGDNNNR